MAFFKGAAKEAQRAMQLQRQREKDRRELELAKMRLESEMRIGEIKNKFAAHSGASYADQSLGAATVGLVTLDEMKRHQERLKRSLAAAAAAADVTGPSQAKRACGDDSPASQHGRHGGGLSFDPDEDADEEDNEDKGKDCGSADGSEAEDTQAAPRSCQDDKPESSEAADDDEDGGDGLNPEAADEDESGKGGAGTRRFGKDPGVATWFLPDKDREAEERRLRAQLEQEWHESQAKLKAEEMEVVFSYWDGSGHRRSVTVTKGTTIGQFLRKVLEQLRKEFQELRSVSEDQLMFIKEDTILPHHVAFLDLITSKARGKSGPLYLFDVKQDVRLTVDTALPSQETHAGKVCMRQWYDRNKHIFPACRWEPFDPTKNWDSLPASLKTANVINVK